jgi:hypothetical protein
MHRAASYPRSPPALWLAFAACAACSTPSKETAAAESMRGDPAQPVSPSPARGQAAGAAENPMPTARSGQPAITASSLVAHRRKAGDVEVTIVWRIDNRATEPLYLLKAQPLDIPTSIPVILDHSSSGGVWQGRPNVVPGFTFVAIPSGESAQLEMTYRLIVPATHREVTIVGRFGYSFTAPSPDWERTKNWKQVAAWQTIIDTSPITVPIR